MTTYWKPVVNMAMHSRKAQTARSDACPLPHPLAPLTHINTIPSRHKPSPAHLPPSAFHNNNPSLPCPSHPAHVVALQLPAAKQPTAHIRRLSSSQNRKSLYITCPPNPNRRALLRQQVAEQRWTQQKRCANAAKFCEIALRPRACVRFAVPCARARVGVSTYWKPVVNVW